ncbi:hypothetical protein [Streptomyces hygroscopicus]|nr:hypothetical protein [Streptomyces hygroscopicus]
MRDAVLLTAPAGAVSALVTPLLIVSRRRTRPAAARDATVAVTVFVTMAP